jgi:4-amino-4-deoxy-L-arabinose transferase-like glycosyltransferase
MVSKKGTTTYPYILLFFCICFYFPFLGKVHLFDWDEVNFVETAREMIVTGNYAQVQINFKPFWEKPPLFFWLQVAAMKLWGINEFAARFPNALVGSITIFTLFSIGKSEKNAKFGLIWALLYFGSFTPHLYFKSGIIDPTFNLFIFLGLYFTYKLASNHLQKKQTYFAIISGLFIGLAILTKGPVAAVIWLFTVAIYWFYFAKFNTIISAKHLVLFAATCLTVSSLWFANELYHNGIWFFSEFLTYQISLFTNPVAGHGQPFYYHFIVVLLGCFPLSVFALPTLLKPADPLGRWMQITFWVVMVLFSITTTKIVHYSSMAYFPLSYIAAGFIYDWVLGRAKFPRWVSVFFIGIGTLLSAVFIIIPLVGQHTASIKPYLKDDFASKNLDAIVHWNGSETLIGAGYFVVVLLFFYFFIVKNNSYKLLIIKVLSISTASVIMLFGYFVVPNIEQYTQAAAVEFYETKRGQDVYVEVLGFKSYAQLFYFQKEKPNNKNSQNIDWLLHGKVDKPVYFVSKTGRVNAYLANKNLRIIYEKNGFVFLKRVQ